MSCLECSARCLEEDGLSSIQCPFVEEGGGDAPNTFETLYMYIRSEPSVNRMLVTDLHYQKRKFNCRQQSCHVGSKSQVSLAVKRRKAK